MKLGLIKNITDNSLEEIQFEIFKGMIKKDLELAVWCNNAVKAFGDFQIYSDTYSEFSSLDYIVAFLTNKKVDFTYEAQEAIISGKCVEHFLRELILRNRKIEGEILEDIASNYTCRV